MSCTFAQDIHNENVHLPKISTMRTHICPKYPPCERTFAQDIHHENAYLPKISRMIMHICPRYPPWERTFSYDIHHENACTFAQDIHHENEHLPKISTMRMNICPGYPPWECTWNVHKNVLLYGHASNHLTWFSPSVNTLPEVRLSNYLTLISFAWGRMRIQISFSH